jgi:hypothetical protein
VVGGKLCGSLVFERCLGAAAGVGPSVRMGLRNLGLFRSLLSLVLSLLGLVLSLLELFCGLFR